MFLVALFLIAKTSFSSGKYPGVALLDHMVVLFLIFWGPSMLFPIVVTPVYNPTHTAWRLSPPSCQCLLFVVFLIIAILINVSWFLFPWWLNDVEHLFIGICFLLDTMSHFVWIIGKKNLILFYFILGLNVSEMRGAQSCICGDFIEL